MMSNLDGCQLPSIPKFAAGPAKLLRKSLILHIKRMLAVPWNRHVKKWLKRAYYTSLRWQGGSAVQTMAKDFAPTVPLKRGDLVRVRPPEEIASTLDPFKELKGCAFLPEMYQYCGTKQRVLKSMQHFMDERDYKLKKARGVVLLEDIICNGTPTFGACDRCCFLFWREEWLEKIAED
ncbi:MAG: hypothetical protein WCC12_07430 [Anaerolineales bacterium]